MKKILLALGCAVALASCVYSDPLDEAGQGEAADVPIYGPGSQDELCPLLEPGACRLDASCRQEGTCLGGTCASIEITSCLPLSMGSPSDARACGELNSDECQSRADCLSAEQIGGGRLCFPEGRTEDTHITEDYRVIVAVDAPRVVH